MTQQFSSPRPFTPIPQAPRGYDPTNEQQSRSSIEARLAGLNSGLTVVSELLDSVFVKLVSDTSGASVNLALIQTALDAGGLVVLLPPSDGVAYLNDALVLKSNTILDLNGGILRMLGTAASHMFHNENWEALPKTVTGNITSASLGGSNRFSKCTVVCTAHGYAVDSFVLIRGDTTNTYNGIHKVYSVPGSGSFTFLLPDSNHEDIPGDSSGSIVASQADAHIEVRNGEIDLNEPGGNNSGDLAAHGFVMNKVLDFRFHDSRIVNVNKYAVFGANLWSPRIENVYTDTGSALCQMTGQIMDFAAKGISGRAGDDVLAWTINETLENILVDADDYVVSGFLVEDMLMEYSGSRGVLLAPESTTYMAGVVLRNIGTQRGVNNVLLMDGGATGGTIEDVTIDGIFGGYDNDAVALVGIGSTTATVIKTLTVRGARNAPLRTRLSGDLVRMNHGSTVNRLVMDDADVTLDTPSTARALVNLQASSIVGYLLFKGCKLKTTGAVSTYATWLIQSSGSGVTDCVVDGGLSSGDSVICDHSSSTATRYTLTGGLVLDCQGATWGAAAFSVTINGITVKNAASSLLNLYGTSKTYNVAAVGIVNPDGDTVFGYGTTNTINITGGDGSLVVDPTKVTFTSPCLFKHSSTGVLSIGGGGIKSISATGGIGYSAGSGGAITQGTSRTTGVTLNTVTGAITLFSAAGSATPATFTVTNSAVVATDVVHVTQKSGTDKYILLVTATGAGSFDITFYTTGGTTTEQPVFNFAVIRGVAS